MPAESPTIEEKTETRDEQAPVWHVVVLNDPVNLMPYVVLVFRRVFGYPRPKAFQHMREVHEQGRSILWSGEREQAEAYVHTLHEWQLHAILQSDD
jgi:ATP-dependent Clp protease adaptor protein ClpS